MHVHTCARGNLIVKVEVGTGWEVHIMLSCHVRREVQVRKQNRQRARALPGRAAEHVAYEAEDRVDVFEQDVVRDGDEARHCHAHIAYWIVEEPRMSVARGQFVHAALLYSPPLVGAGLCVGMSLGGLGGDEPGEPWLDRHPERGGGTGRSHAHAVSP
ncbi:hypothetical protein BDW22DRAFT_1348671 [Trametopsis cervina]|nr:hypothetical protein BDW22DRAFT_1348671 [Trametopsis cervina]